MKSIEERVKDAEFALSKAMNERDLPDSEDGIRLMLLNIQKILQGRRRTIFVRSAELILVFA